MSLSLVGLLKCGLTSISTSILLNSQDLFTDSPPLRAHLGGTWRTDWSLISTTNVSGADVLGSYTGVDCLYALSDSPDYAVFSASIYTYPTAEAAPDASLVRFRYGFPNGAVRTNHT